MTKVLIADDHALVRDGLRHILQNARGFDVAGEARDSASTIALMRDTDADVLVLDLSMPGRNGVELIKQIKDEKPALQILVLTMHAEQQYAVRAFRAGASGYMTKESASAELVAALTKIADKLGTGPSQVALAWVLKRSPVMLPIPGTGSTKHLRENVAGASIDLSDEDFKALDAQGRAEYAKAA